MVKSVLYVQQGEEHKREGVYPNTVAIKRGNHLMGTGKWVTLIKDGLTEKPILTESELGKYIEG